MFFALVLANIALRVCICKDSFVIWVYGCGIPECKLTQAIGRTIAQYIDDATRTNAFTTGTDVTAVCEFRVVVKGQVVSDVYDKLTVQVCTAYTSTEDDTAVIALGQ